MCPYEKKGIIIQGGVGNVTYPGEGGDDEDDFWMLLPFGYIHGGLILLQSEKHLVHTK